MEYGKTAVKADQMFFIPDFDQAPPLMRIAALFYLNPYTGIAIWYPELPYAILVKKH